MGNGLLVPVEQRFIGVEIARFRGGVVAAASPAECSCGFSSGRRVLYLKSGTTPSAVHHSIK